MPTQEEMLDEAYRRNLLPADLKGMYEEAKKRGIVGSAEDPYGPRGLVQRAASGIGDISTGATQLLAHTIGEEGFESANQWLETHLPKSVHEFLSQSDVPDEAPGSQEDFDAYTKRRSEILEQRYGQPGFDLARVSGQTAALAPALPAKLLQARPILGSMGLGGLAGAAEPVTDTSQGYWGQKALQTGIGSLEGLLFGTTGKAVGGAVDAAGRKIAQKISLPDIEKYLDPRKRSRIQTAVTDTLAKQTLAERMAADKAGGGLSQAELLKLVREANAHGIPMTMADFADPELAGLVGNLARQPGPARTRIRKFLEDRDIGEGKYLTQAVRRIMIGGNDTSAYRTGQALITQQAKDAAPLYDLVAKHPGVEISPTLEIMLETDALRGALKPGIEFETNMAASEGKRFDPAALGILKDSEGNYVMPKAPQLRVLDIAKKGLDGMIKAERDAAGRLSQRGLGLDRLRRAFLDEIDRLDQTGIYKRAREAWAGPAASLDAIELGQKVFQHDPEEFADLLGQMSEKNKDFVRIGAASAMIKKLNQVGLHGDEAKALVRSSYARQQIEPLFKSTAAYNAFIREIDYAIQRFESKRRYMGGSQTAERLAEDRSGKITKMAVAAQVLKELATGHPIGALNAVRHIYRYWRDVGFEPDEKLNDAIAKIVLTTDEPGAKRHKVPERFNLKRLENPLRSVSPVVRDLVSRIGTVAGAANQPEGL